MEECNESNLNLTVVIMQVASRGQISFNPIFKYYFILVNREDRKLVVSMVQEGMNPIFT